MKFHALINIKIKNLTIMTKTLIICSAAFAICFAFQEIAFAAFAAVSLLIVLAALGIIEITFTTVDFRR